MQTTYTKPTSVLIDMRDKAGNEKEMEALLRAYILNPHNPNRPSETMFAFGGIVNLCTTIAKICNELSEAGGEYYDEAERSFDSAAAALDLPYKTPDEVALRNG